MKTIEYEGALFYVGQNCSENDELYKKMPLNSTWFHLESETSSHVYCVFESKLTKEHIKKGAELIRKWSKKNDKVIYITKDKLKRLGPGLIDLLESPKYA